LLKHSSSFEREKVYLTKIRFDREGRKVKVIPACNVFKGDQTHTELAEIYVCIHTAMNSFTLTSGTSAAGRKYSNVMLDHNNILSIIIAAIHIDRFSTDCYHFEFPYLILI